MEIMTRLYSIFWIIVALTLVSCDPIGKNPPEFEQKDKTVLIYMVANNNLHSSAGSNIQDMKGGYIPEDGNLVVYLHDTKNNPVLLHLNKDKEGRVVQDTAYRFPIRNSAEPETLTSVMSVTRTMFPAREYGMFLWSHGTGWLPEGYYSTKSFGSENGVEMDIKDLAKALPYKLSFIVFDACLMGSIEVAYQLKDSVDYIISSPAEIISYGFPYGKIMEHIFQTPTDLQGVAKEFYDYYNSQSGSSRSATISLVRTSALAEVAEAAAPIFDKYREKLSSFDQYSVQRYYRSNKKWFFDFGDLMNQLAGVEEATPVIRALNNAVIYKAATPSFLGVQIDPEKYSGLSTYIPLAPSDPELDAYYKLFQWNKDVQMLVD